MSDAPTTDPLVRHVRMADTLIDRLDQLDREDRSLKPATWLYRVLTFRTILQNNDAAELRIGEARQIAPAVWENLDDAQVILARRGVDCPGYARARDGSSQLVIELAHVRKMILAMRAASSVLKQATPDVDWETVARAEIDELAGAGSLRSKRWVGLVVLVTLLAIGGVVLWLVASGPGKEPPLMNCFARCSRVNGLQLVKPPSRDCEAAVARFCADGRGDVLEVRSRPH